MKQVPSQLSRGISSVDGGRMTGPPWYAFMDRPRSPDGERLRFSRVRDALRWMVVTLAVVAFWLGLLISLIVLGALDGSRVAVILFVILMAPTVGPIVVASMIAFAKTLGDLRSIHSDRHRIRQA
jgi:hypothetical protein